MRFIENLNHCDNDFESPLRYGKTRNRFCNSHKYSVNV